MPTHDTTHIPEGWKETTLGEVSGVQTGPFGTQLHEEDYVLNGTPIITVEHLVNNKVIINMTNVPMVSTEDKLRLDKYVLREGDIVFSRVGSVDRCGYISRLEDGWLFSGRLLRVRAHDKLNKKFVFYWLSQPLIKEFVRKSAVGATMPSINTELLSRVPISIPPLPEQRAIADMLSSFDAKIELLREQNETLEKTAQTIFQEWFGAPQPHEGGASEKSPLGDLGALLPEGWRVGRLGEILKLLYGKALISENRKNDGFPVIGSSGVVGFHDEFLVNGPGIVIGRKGNMGSILWIEESFFPIDTTFYVEDLLGVNALHYHLLLLKSLDFSKIGSDSAVPGLNRDAAYSVEIIIPSNEKILEFIQMIKPILEKKSQNNSQIQTLWKTRNELLPRLMSGEVKVET